jgi:Flp pilus assembly protein TadB
MLNKYLIGALGIVCVTIGLLWWRLDAVASERDKWRETANTNAATIAALEAESDRLEAIRTELRDSLDLIRQDGAQTRRALANVEASNAEVRSLLDARLPDALAGVLWPGGEDGDDPAQTASRPDAPVQGERP